MECFLLMIVVAIIGILAAIAIPAYQNYIAKSQVTRAMAEIGSIKTAVETCLNEGQTTVGVAAGNCQLGNTTSNIQTLTAVATLSETQVLTGTFGTNAAASLTGDTVNWVRSADGSWRCWTSVETKYRPANCTASV